ncbi:hypothetical protein [Streptomyces sp. NPDC060010]|uniref:hypothetical protein n=1 Tax=Streptomyces sp. NPDC060010 TaxID=3347036 RepID=UPI0036C27F7D
MLGQVGALGEVLASHPNVTRGPHILDWEGWGRAPYGYDAATLYVYALLVPETAARIRTQLTPVLDRPEARTGLLTVCAQVYNGTFEPCALRTRRPAGQHPTQDQSRR